MMECGLMDREKNAHIKLRGGCRGEEGGERRKGRGVGGERDRQGGARGTGVARSERVWVGQQS